MRNARLYTLILCSLIVRLVEPVQVRAQSAPDAASLRARALKVFEPLPAKMPGSESDTREMVKLGRKLFMDRRLSGDKTISCNSCHSLASGGSYARATTRTRKPVKHGRRDSPTIYNAGFQIAQFWDGRSPDLEAQARQPMLNPDEMAMPAEDELLKRLRDIRSYRWRFSDAFPEDAEPVTIENAARAFAAFERTLISEDRFDDFLKGRDRALSRAEQTGLALFLDNNCQKCHDGPGLGGNSFQKMGVMHPYANTNDFGRFEVTGLEIDRYQFKVPPLRNVALTAPYFHDGKAATLTDAVRSMAHLQLDKQLSDAEVESIVAFLRSLSDKNLVRSNRQ